MADKQVDKKTDLSIPIHVFNACTTCSCLDDTYAGLIISGYDVSSLDLLKVVRATALGCIKLKKKK